MAKQAFQYSLANAIQTELEANNYQVIGVIFNWGNDDLTIQFADGVSQQDQDDATAMAQAMVADKVTLRDAWLVEP